MATLLTAVDLAHEWRPQRYGRKRAHQIEDPIVEPLWDGPRVLVAVEDGVVTPFHDGARVAGPAAILTQLEHATSASGLVIEGHLTEQALGTGEGASLETQEKTPGMVGRLMGNLGGGKRERLIREKEEAAVLARRTEQVVTGNAGPLAFVATDLLWLDGEPLLDVPLLERKRLLDSTLEESELIRLTAFVRPTARGSLMGWKALGFRVLAYKGANSRYRPGEINDAWAMVEITGSTPAPLAHP